MPAVSLTPTLSRRAREIVGSPLLGQLSFDGRFEYRRSVTLQVGLRPLQRRHPGVEIGEQFLNLDDDAALLVEGSNRQW